MAVISREAIVRLGVEHAAAGLALSTEACWNQSEADWRFFLSHGAVLGISDAQGKLIATAALLPYPPAAWISMVLVTANWRRRGLATLLVRECLALARDSALVPWLDATPAGAAVYEPLGFVTTLSFQRLRLPSRAATTPALAAPPSPDDLRRLLDQDRRAMGIGREALLRELAARPQSTIYSQRHTLCLMRMGRAAVHIGPAFATDQAAAAERFDQIARHHPGPAIVDVLDDKSEVIAALTARGWTIERPFRRMRFGGAATQETGRLIAVAGPEFG